jgi:ribulose-5-phosphate 4-epimerase/fuculose-1-phosphate aldolase
MDTYDSEQALRVELAALYRLVAFFKWDDLVFTHISVRVPGPSPAFLINPYGWLFEASSRHSTGLWPN